MKNGNKPTAKKNKRWIETEKNKKQKMRKNIEQENIKIEDAGKSKNKKKPKK